MDGRTSANDVLSRHFETRKESVTVLFELENNQERGRPIREQCPPGKSVFDVVLVDDVIVVVFDTFHQRHDAAAALCPFQSVSSFDCLFASHLTEIKVPRSSNPSENVTYLVRLCRIIV